MGAGTGFERGVQNLSQIVMQGLRLRMQQKRYDQLDERYNKAFDYQADFERGQKGLLPLYTEEDQANAAAATRPEVPSSTPTVTPGPLGVPQTTFPVGKPVQPMPATAPNPTGGAMGLIPSTIRPRMPSIGRNPGMGTPDRLRFRR